MKLVALRDAVEIWLCVCVCVSTSLPRLCICFFLSVVEDTFEKLAVLDAVPKTSVDLSPRLHTGLSDCLPLSLPLSPLPSDSPPPFSPAVGSDCSHCGQKWWGRVKLLLVLMRNPAAPPCSNPPPRLCAQQAYWLADWPVVIGLLFSSHLQWRAFLLEHSSSSVSSVNFRITFLHL